METWDQAFKALAPQAAQPGTGAGGRPYAPGIVNGEYGNPGSHSLFNRLGQMAGQNGARQAMQAATSQYSGTPGSDQPPAMPPQPSLQWTPQVQQEVLNYIMGLLSGGQSYQMTTTGGYNPNGPTR